MKSVISKAIILVAMTLAAFGSVFLDRKIEKDPATQLVNERSTIESLDRLITNTCSELSDTHSVYAQQPVLNNLRQLVRARNEHVRTYTKEVWRSSIGSECRGVEQTLPQLRSENQICS